MKPEEPRTFTRKDLTTSQWQELVLRQASPDIVEYGMSLFAIGWGFWVILPWFNAFDVSPHTYKYMRLIFHDEFVWGALVLSIGISIRTFLYTDNRPGRYWCMFVMCSIWGLMSGCLLLSDWRGTGWIVYGILCHSANWARRRVRQKVSTSLTGDPT